MRIAEQTEIEAPLERTWPLLHNVELIAECLPGAEIHETGGENDDEHRGTLTVEFGPTRVTFSGQIRFEVAHEEHRVDIHGRGQDSRGRNRASIKLVVTALEVDERKTRLDIDGDIDVKGPLERFASTGGQHIAQELLHSFSENIVSHVEQPRPSRASEPPSAGERPKQSTLSLGKLIWRALKRWLRL